MIEAYYDSYKLIYAADTVDKSDWGVGPWGGEQDLYIIQFIDSNNLCIVNRHPALGTLLGYVLIQPTHPAFGLENEEIDTQFKPYVYGGITWSAKYLPFQSNSTEYTIPKDFWIHIATYYDFDNYWAIGFDFMHGIPLWFSPSMKKSLQKLNLKSFDKIYSSSDAGYHNLTDCIVNLSRLDEALGSVPKLQPISEDLID